MRRRLALAILLSSLPLSAAADPRDDVLRALARCTELGDRDQRTGCYDGLAPQLRAVVAPSAEGASPVAAPPPEPPAQGSIFNALNPFSDDSRPPSPAQMAYQAFGQEILPVTIAVSSFEVAPVGGFTVTLANGQVWTERKEHFDKPPFMAGQANVVTIERALLGGYNLYLKGHGQPYKVQRIR